MEYPISFYTFKKYLPCMLMYTRKKIPMTTVKNIQTADDRRFKQSNFNYTMVVLFSQYCKYIYFKLKWFRQNVLYM